MSEPVRRQAAGAAELVDALAAGEPVRLVLHAPSPRDPAVVAALARAGAAGVPLHEASARVLWRLGKCTPAPELIAVIGPDPNASPAESLAGDGVAWLLTGLAYPGNTGFAIRLAEVSGAACVFVDASFAHEGKREALRASMRADRFFPVYWEPALAAIAHAKRASRRVLAIEDVGTLAPWEVDLRARSLLVVGGERHGIPPEVLAACDGAVRIPMRGFIPSYNVQAAMAIVAGERLRQLGASDRARP